MILSVPLKDELVARIDRGLFNSPFQNRLEYIRYLLDMALTEEERHAP